MVDLSRRAFLIFGSLAAAGAARIGRPKPRDRGVYSNTYSNTY